MSVQSGLGGRFYVGQYDLSGDVGAIGTCQDSRAQQDISSVLDLGTRRQYLRRDGQLAYTAFWDNAAGKAHAVLKGMPQGTIHTWCVSAGLGGAAAPLVANQSSYQDQVGQDGSLSIAAAAMDSGGFGIEWADLLTTAPQTFASAAAGSSVDDYVPVFPTLPLPSVLGLAAYLHVISVGSGSATVHVQDSADNVSFADVTGAVFTAASGPTSERIATSATQAVRRYLRVNVTGTFTNLVCVVAAHRFVV
jgi:hypothetical protein